MATIIKVVIGTFHWGRFWFEGTFGSRDSAYFLEKGEVYLFSGRGGKYSAQALK